MTFIVLKFSFLAIKGEMDRKDEKSHHSQKTPDAAFGVANLPIERQGPQKKKAEKLIQEGEIALCASGI